jgi:hypothetical protein
VTEYPHLRPTYGELCWAVGALESLLPDLAKLPGRARTEAVDLVLDTIAAYERLEVTP